MKKIKYLIILLTYAFIFNTTVLADGSTDEKAQHRLPPVIYSIDKLPKTIKSGISYSVEWSVMGYHEKYDIHIQISNNNGDNVFSKTISPYNTSTGQYSWGDIKSKRFFYKTNFKLNYSTAQNFTVRFFASPVTDPYDNTFLSALVPSGLGYEAGDTTGRKIVIYGSVNNADRNWSTLVQNARVGDILLFAPKAGCEDGACFANSTFEVVGINIPYGYYRHAALVYKKDINGITVLHARGPGNGVGTNLYNYKKLKNPGWEVISLLRVKNITNLWAKKTMLDAHKKFNDSEYGLFVGTYCSELIQEAYKDIADLSDGGSLFGIYTPDSILSSSKIKMINTASF